MGISVSESRVSKSRIARRLTRLFIGLAILTMMIGNVILGNLGHKLWSDGATEISHRYLQLLREHPELTPPQNGKGAPALPLDNAAHIRLMRAAMESTSSRIDKTIGQASILVTIAACIIGYWLALKTAERIIRPLMLLSRAANEIAGGRLGKRVSEDSPDEIGDLAAAFNQMTEALERSRNDLGQAYERMEILATQDGLTGLANRRTFQERLAKEWERAAEQRLTFSLILLDVDKFKTYNDTYGHLAGDAVLQTVGALLQKTTRDMDLVARYGGEEFVVILTNTEAQTASRIAERFRTTIEEHIWPERPITISLGVASLTPAITDAAHLIAAADEALYKAKSLGRNRVVHGQIEAGLISGQTENRDSRKAA